jgi:FAD/FMN-containing dehydrogenase
MRHVVTALDAADVADIVRDAGRAGFRIAANPAVNPASSLAAAPATRLTASLTPSLASNPASNPATDPTPHHCHPPSDDTLLLNTAALTDLTICPSSRTARVGAAVTTSQLASAAASHGLLAIPGSSPHATAINAVLTGGLGRTARHHGLASDHAVAFEVVDADGNRLRASAHENEDLFWALSGGSGDFAIVTAMEVRLHATPDLTTRTTAWPLDSAEDVLRAFRDIAAAAPDNLMLQLTLSPSEVLVCATFLGSANDARVLLEPLIAVPGATTLADAPRQPTAPQTALLSGLDDTAPWIRLSERLPYLTGAAGPSRPATAQLTVRLQHLGGQLSRYSTKGPHGPVTEQFLLAMTGPAAEHHDDLVVALGITVSPRKTLDLLSPDEPPSRAFGTEELTLLREIKAAWDPAGLFVGDYFAAGQQLAGVG